MTRGLLLISGAAGCWHLRAVPSPVPDDTVRGRGLWRLLRCLSADANRWPHRQQSPLQRRSQSLPVSDETIIPPSAAQIGEDEIADLARSAHCRGRSQSLSIRRLPEAESASSGGAAPRDSSALSLMSRSFDAVAARETIETDAERLERMAAAAGRNRTPTDLPDRPGSTGPNIVEYALSTSHPVGQQVYRRSALGCRVGMRKTALSYQSSDLAQQAFLSMGGPETGSPGGSISDGDGYACSAGTPTIYRNAAHGG